MSVVTEFQRTRAESKAELISRFEYAPFGLVECRPSGTITALNLAAEQLLGSGAKIARSFSLADLIHSQDQAMCERLVQELCDGKRESFQMRTARGSRRNPLRWIVWRVAGANGDPESILAFVEEALENREADERLRQAERLEAVGRLAGGVAHDFNNLLTGVLLYCDLLMANLEPCHRVRKYAEEIRNAGLQATGLVRQLLAMARPANSEPRLLSLNEIAEGMRNLLVRLIGENIELELRLDPNLGLVRMDPTQAQQILLNLVLNSRDAMPHGGKIAVRTGNCKLQVLPEAGMGEEGAASLPCALFTVTDNGNGMDPATRAHVFEAFFTTKAGGKGTGLGLATVHDIVTRNGGLINVDSATAHGTCVTVLLPLVPEAALQKEIQSSPSSIDSSFIREKE